MNRNDLVTRINERMALLLQHDRAERASDFLRRAAEAVADEVVPLLAVRPAPAGLIRATYTYAILEISEQAFREIYSKLRDARYEHAFHQTEDRMVIDMHGIALGDRG